MKTKILTFSCLLLGACGGKGAVDLGGNSGKAGWADTKGTITTDPNPGQITRIPSAVPQTLYDGDLVRAIAVDETTIAAAIQSPNGNHIDVCQLADCEGTLQTIYQESSDECWDSARGSSPSRFVHLLISHGEVIWIDCTATGGSHLVACSTSGCPAGARRISRVIEVDSLVASADWVYWRDRSPQLGMARCPRAGCDVAEVLPISDANIAALFAIGKGDERRLVLDDSGAMLYASGGVGISRMPADFSAQLTPFYEDPVGVTGLAVAGDYVYFARSTLTGQILRCSTAGCEQGPELVTSAPRWPHSPIADERAVYWWHEAQANIIYVDEVIDGVISAFPLDGSAASAAEVAKLGHLHGHFSEGDLEGPLGPVMNSHHLYWSERGGIGTYPFNWVIKAVAR